MESEFNNKLWMAPDDQSSNRDSFAVFLDCRMPLPVETFENKLLIKEMMMLKESLLEERGSEPLSQVETSNQHPDEHKMVNGNGIVK